MVEFRDVAVLLADLTGSTPLYETLGNEAAAKIVAECRDEMRAIAEREGGEFIHYRGDDILCIFENCASALKAAKEIVRVGGTDRPGVHAGLTWGQIIRGRDEVFGDAVNLASRLGSMSNPGEVLMSGDFAEGLNDNDQRRLRPMDHVSLKGKALPVEVYGALGHELEMQTTQAPGLGMSAAETSVRLEVAGEEHALGEGEALVIGRGLDCQVVLGSPHISRRHAAFTVRGGLAEFTDYSSTGSYLKFGEADPFYVRRKPVVLSGRGAISLGVDMADAREEMIWFAVEQG